jgi:hypothetical protein
MVDCDYIERVVRDWKKFVTRFERRIFESQP